MQQQPFSNFQEFLRSLKIIHGAMLIGMVLMGLGLKYLMSGESHDQSDLLYPAIGISAAMGGLVIGHLIFKNKIETIRKTNPPTIEKLENYYAASILKFAMLEGPALICLVLHFLGGNNLLFYAFIFMLVMFGLERPTADKIAQALNLSSKEVQ